MKPRQGGRGGLVWSSDPEVTRRCEEPRAPSRHGPAPMPSDSQEARVLRARKGRRGKTVTVIEGLRLTPEAYQDLASSLRQALGTGGTVKDETIEVQGDLRERVAEYLRQHGYRARIVGG